MADKDEGLPIARAAVAVARAQGCNCEPEVEVGERNGVLVPVRMSHDRWCAHPSLRMTDDD